MFLDETMRDPIGVKNKTIDCFSLSDEGINTFLRGFNLCLRNTTEDGFCLSYLDVRHPNYFLIKNKDRQMKLVTKFSPHRLQTEANTEPFDGLLDGVPITAAFNWTQPDKQFVYFFAGRRLCRQQISFDWVPMCDIEDIGRLVNQVIGCRAMSCSVISQTHYTIVILSVVISLFRF